MKTVIMTLLALGLVITAGFAEDSATPKGKDQPCLKIEQACKAAGFVKGGAKEGKGLIVDCVKPLLEGKNVLGVTVDAATRKACQDKSKARRASRDEGKVDPAKSK